MTTKIINDYEFNMEEWLGTGSFATVYKGTHIKTGKVVAIKEIDINKLRRTYEYSENDKIMRNINSEIKTMQLMHHDNILKMEDILVTGDKVYMILEYCDIGDLSKYMTAYKQHHLDNPNMSEEQVKTIVEQIMCGMKYMNSLGIVHRDIKPHNILLQTNNMCPNGILVKISDFGFAKVMNPNDNANTICGSPMYMSPEVLICDEYCNKTDLWGVGVILYEMLVGRVPINARTLIELGDIYKKMDHVSIPSKVHLSDNCGDLIERLLTVDPKKRLEWDEFTSHVWFRGNANKNATMDVVAQTSDIQFCGSAPARMQMNNILLRNDTTMTCDVIDNVLRNTIRPKIGTNDISDILYECRSWLERLNTLMKVGYDDINANYYISGHKIFSHVKHIVIVLNNIICDIECDDNDILMLNIQFNKMNNECIKIITMCSHQIRSTEKCKVTEKLIYDKAVSLEERGKMNLEIDNFKCAYNDFIDCINLFSSILQFTTESYNISIKKHLTECISILKCVKSQ